MLFRKTGRSRMYFQLNNLIKNAWFFMHNENTE